ncbi:hypothetical protein V8E36_009872 [Tilletia maclaganii]
MPSRGRRDTSTAPSVLSGTYQVGQSAGGRAKAQARADQAVLRCAHHSSDLFTAAFHWTLPAVASHISTGRSSQAYTLQRPKYRLHQLPALHLTLPTHHSSQVRHEGARSRPRRSNGQGSSCRAKDRYRQPARAGRARGTGASESPYQASVFALTPILKTNNHHDEHSHTHIHRSIIMYLLSFIVVTSCNLDVLMHAIYLLRCSTAHALHCALH